MPYQLYHIINYASILNVMIFPTDQLLIAVVVSTLIVTLFKQSYWFFVFVQGERHGGGCDTTSALFNKGKNFLRTFEKLSGLEELGAAFEGKDCLLQRLFESGLQILLLTSLPPSSAHQHFNRVYYQVQTWLGHDLEPQKWDWTMRNGFLEPVTTILPPAPDELLNTIFCNCKSGCGSRCGCRKAGLQCSLDKLVLMQ
nr:unnamed protein product [Callosobruchus analis]